MSTSSIYAFYCILFQVDLSCCSFHLFVRTVKKLVVLNSCICCVFIHFSACLNFYYRPLSSSNPYSTTYCYKNIFILIVISSSKDIFRFKCHLLLPVSSLCPQWMAPSPVPTTNCLQSSAQSLLPIAQSSLPIIQLQLTSASCLLPTN